jgi:hypothetical protein
MALHAPMNITWHGCADGNGRRRRQRNRSRRYLQGAMGSDLFHRRMYMMNDRPLDVVPYVADLLEAGIPVLVYNGDRDMTTCVTGSELLLNGMEWTGKEEWMDASRGVWMIEDVKGGEGGWAKEYRGLTFVVVYNSGHSEYAINGHIFNPISPQFTPLRTVLSLKRHESISLISFPNLLFFTIVYRLCLLKF